MKTLISCLAIAILFVIVVPRNHETSAQQDLGKAIEVPEQVPKDSQVLDLLDRLTRNDATMMELIRNQGTELAAVEECRAKESEALKTQLVALQSAGDSECQCACDCTATIAALTERVEALEARCPGKTNYPAVSSVKSGGSAGSYGSAGSAAVSVGRSPVRTAAKVVTSPFARAGHWTYPGEIGNHLASDHGVSTAGMTREQQLDLHDSIHEGQPVQAPRPMVKRLPMVSNSSCPGGNCPTSRTQSNGWFLGRAFSRR